MRVVVWVCVAVCVCGAATAQARGSRGWRARSPDDRAPGQFVGPHVCRSRNSTHCCPGWTARPNSMLCVVPICRPDCGSPGSCVAPNMCRCPGGTEAPSCGYGTNNYPYPIRTKGGCPRICMNGGTCSNSTCACAPGWTGEFCTEPICREPCLHGGRCIAPDRCVCFHGLSGKRCEIDRRTGPCYTERRETLCTGALQGVVCTRQLCCATVGAAWGHPCQRCGDLDCPSGHLLHRQTNQCQDIDECAAIPGLCEGGKCINSIGSFSCECPPGQRRHPRTNNCEDIDECEDRDICPNGKCVNTEGDYYCLCNPHFIPSPDKKFCIDGRVGECYTYMSETGECSDRLQVPLSNRDCCCGYNMGRAWGELCAACPPRGSTEWTHLCGTGIVPPDWRRNDSTSDHGDDFTGNGIGSGGGNNVPGLIAQINECMLRSGICGLGDCVDKDVGYSCSCWSGAELARPDGNPTCLDIDECALGHCRGGTCVNKPNGFDCRCPPGFDPVENGLRCSDMSECEATNGASCSNGVCQTTGDGWECVCKSGFTRGEGLGACVDVDECRDNPRVCRRGACGNTQGGYHCRCEPGYHYSDAGYCVDVDECLDPTLCQGGRCVNSEGSFVCVCAAGLAARGGRCADLDECLDAALCRNGRCRNTPGSFRCDCHAGFTLANAGRTCIDEVQDLCYEKFEEGRCSGPGSIPITRSQCCCSSSKGLQLGWGVACKACPEPGTDEYKILCPEGPSKDNGGADINECIVIPGICPHGTCENLEPGYRCICDPGYHPDSDGICRDIDECDMNQSYCSGGQCRNSPGSYSCVCPAGTRLLPAAAACLDRDECAELTNPCDNGRCINTHGGYECECEIGFVLDNTQQHCIDNRRGSCWRRVVDGRCEAALGRVLLRQECCCGLGLAWGAPCEPCDPDDCPCVRGYAQLDGATCRDIDECSLDPDLCIGGNCLNTDGSFRCECPPGLTLDDTGNRCVDVRQEVCYWEWGGSGGSPLPGAVRRAVCCCGALGRAWGARPEPCPARGTDAYRNLCISDSMGPNVPPSVWIRPMGNGSAIWDQVAETDKYGRPIGPGGPGLDNGTWPGYDPGSGLVPGQMEVNECAAFPGLCGHGLCKNTVGSFECECYPGYEQDSKNRTCVDINECEIVAEVCGRGECRNTEGSFQCRCLDGYRPDDDSKVCLDIDECAESPLLCAGGRCENTLGSFSCHCGRGLQLAADSLSCKDVDECSITSGICSNGACENLMGTYQCVCDSGYAQSSVKSHCEDIDECGEEPPRCDHGCDNTPGSYVCTCREGWSLRADGRSCRDVDECSSGRVCGAGECRNTPGSFTCACGPGLAQDRPGGVCRDIDECEISDLCGAGECHNTIGSFVCRCPDGYSVKPDVGPACTDDDECELGTCDCHPAADCINTPGSFQCRCRDGWIGPGSSCSDVDECLTNNGGCHPRAVCTNTEGSFLCLCDQGYKGDGYSCVDIDECANDPLLCENGHCSNAPGGYRCDCDVGFTAAEDARACLDMDECATFDNVCVFGRCVNTYGMFKCICDKGYQSDSVDDLMPGFNCTDVDECKSPQSCQYGACVNSPGSYECRCPPNHDLVSGGTACFDNRKARCFGRVEVRSGGEQCRHSDQLAEEGSMSACCCSVGAAWGNYCELCPEPGSEEFRQLCPGGPGYQPVLEPPSFVVSLADIDECSQLPGLCAHGTCTNTFGSFVCSCGAGWQLAPGGRACLDRDECQAGLCGAGVCRNLPGTYVCLCPDGYVPMPSNKECVDVRQRQCYMDYDSDSEQCSHAIGVPQTKYLCCCSVGRGWGSPCESCPERGSVEYTQLCGERPGEYKNPMTNETKPIDECELMPQLCKPGVCHDTPTGFQCGCEDGYEHDTSSHQCRDQDECSQLPAPCLGLAACVNSAGSYSCRCPPGYRAHQALGCEDEDECLQPLACRHGDCTNTVGSYRCECGFGFALRDGACEDIDECARVRPVCKNGSCHNTPGGYSCRCHEGFTQGPNNDCIDINECREGDMVCRNGHCRNSIGSFSCECAAGYRLALDGRHCIDIDECEDPLACGEDGDPKCTNTMGGYECSCGAGWRVAGKRCEDRDECRDERVCAGGECRNLDGGFACECPAGWQFEELSSQCVDHRSELCYERWEAGRCHLARPLRLSRPDCCCSTGAAWGRHCEQCPAPDSAEFLQVCQGGMGRPNLTHDLDECVVRPGVCQSGRCVNTDGSFRCACPAGYLLAPGGLACLDRDECQEEPRICGDGTCANTPGGYECTCNTGFTQGPDQTCVDIDECSVGSARCSFRCHNTWGSYRCTCPYGYRLAPDGRHCADEDECLRPGVCPHHCENTVGSYLCKCPQGYRRTSAPHDSAEACEDIDECALPGERCGGGVCLNLEGGHQCDCDPGWQAAPDGKSCIDRRTGLCHRSLVSGHCVPEPWPRAMSSTPATPAQVTRAQCCCTVGIAWGPECEICPLPATPERMELCSPTNLLPPRGESKKDGTGGGSGGTGADGGGIGSGGGGIGNGAGGFGTGGGGFGFDDGGMDIYGDIDECAAMPGLCLPGRCVNTVGSFRCACGLGYKPTSESCVDVDECQLRPAPCGHTCRNSAGSYTCSCRPGYLLHEDDTSCVDEDECTRNTHTCQQICTNTEGSYDCSCDEGYEKRGDACVDINECLEAEICGSGGKCVNLLGSYRCVCPRGARGGDGACRAPPRCGADAWRVGGCGPDGPDGPGGPLGPVDPCGPGPCGPAPCFPLAGSYRCGCPQGYGWDQGHGVCLQLSGGCAVASCLFGCSESPWGGPPTCGCPAGYSEPAAGQCLRAAPSGPDLAGAPVFPLQDEYKADEDIISTEGCFSCKINGRHRRAPEEGIVFANGTTVIRRKRRRSRRRRSVLEPEAELVVIRVSPQDTWRRAALLQLVPAEGGARPHYRLSYGDPEQDFILNKRDGVWALRLRRHVRPNEILQRQLEIEARFVTLQSDRQGRGRRRRQVAPPPLRLYVSVYVQPTK